MKGKKGKKKKVVPLKTTWLSPFKHNEIEVNVKKIKISEKQIIYRFEDKYDANYFKAKNLNEAKKKYKKYIGKGKFSSWIRK